MNTRTRQWLKASMRLEEHDPSLLALVPVEMLGSWQTKQAVVFRKSRLQKMKDKYGDDMEVIIGDDR